MTVGSSESSGASASGEPTVEEQLNNAGLGKRQLFLFVIVSMLVAADGMEMVVISLLHNSLKEEWGLDELGFATLGSIVFAGLLVGNLSGGLLADKFGRRMTLIGAAAVFGVGGLASAAATNVWMFAVCRFVTGVGVGSMIPVADSLIIEWSPTKWRGTLAMLLMGVAFPVGSLFACVVGIVMHDLWGGEGNWWRYMVLVCVLPGVISFPLMYMYLPESPHWLMVQGRSQEAEAVLAETARDNGKEPLMGGKVVDSGHKHEPIPFWQCFDALFQPNLVWTTVFITVSFTVCGFVYYGHIFIYPILLETEYHMEVREAYGTMMIGIVVEIAAILGSMVLMDVGGVGRRGTITAGFLLCFVVATLTMLSQNVAQFIFLNSSIRALIEGPFTVIYIFAGELLPSSHRASGISLCNSFGRIAAMCAPIITTWALDKSVLWVYAIFAAASGAALISAVLFKRETLGKPLNEFPEEIVDDDEEKRPLV